MDGIDVGGDAPDQVAGLRLIVIGERETLHPGIQPAPQIVHDPLASAGGEVFLDVGADGAHQCDREGRQRCKPEDRLPILANGGNNPAVQPAVRWPRSKDIVENDLQRPRFQQIGDSLANSRQEPGGQSLGMWSQQLAKNTKLAFIYAPVAYATGRGAQLRRAFG